jgi:hypothetical protein
LNDDERDFKDHPDNKGAPLVFMVEPEKRITACGTCRHVRPGSSGDPHSQQCAAVGTFTAGLRKRDRVTGQIVPCNMWEPQPEPAPPKREPRPPELPRVGLIRWIFRTLKRWLW